MLMLSPSRVRRRKASTPASVPGILTITLGNRAALEDLLVARGRGRGTDLLVVEVGLQHRLREDRRIRGATRHVVLARELRQVAARQRRRAEHRNQAVAARAHAAADRERGTRDRAQARADCEALMRQLLIAETDGLTGACTRGPGVADIDREIARARGTNGLLLAAYVSLGRFYGVR